MIETPSLNSAPCGSVDTLIFNTIWRVGVGWGGLPRPGFAHVLGKSHHKKDMSMEGRDSWLFLGPALLGDVKPGRQPSKDDNWCQ